MRLRRALTATAIAGLALTGVATAAPAQAAPTGTYLYNPAIWADVPTWTGTSYPEFAYAIVPDNSTFTMRCWIDWAGERWFHGNQALLGPGRVWVKAQHVRNQIGVGHC